MEENNLKISLALYIRSEFSSKINKSVATTLLTQSFGNHRFANYHVHKHPITNLIMSSFCIPKVLKSAAKILEIGSQIKLNAQK